MSRRPLGPGPGAYMLPSSFGYSNNVPTGRRSPGYSFGLRGPDDIKKAGPGPGAYKTDALTRYGKSRYLNYS
ncbi:PREDICTED: outer dense fiber protein 3-like protein 2 [Bactrocera latifrons]|uniref:outer dense fiber protein 3-like protein 2 n=1 Tax=Bactrocera latifrons TaxID=174628 RepID=UPI0008DDCE1F|nr:PREDICTED: outer dense fiber protein 3-like protein 2 [Bactrocera latifrons]